MRLNLIFQFLLFSKHLKDKLRLLVPWATHNANVDKSVCFSTLACSCYGPNFSKELKEILCLRIYAHVKGSSCVLFVVVFFVFFWGGGGSFLLSVNFFQNPFSTVSVWFENKLQFCMDFLNVHFETNDQQIFLK